jgi:hypothetical protein
MSTTEPSRPPRRPFRAAAVRSVGPPVLAAAGVCAALAAVAVTVGPTVGSVPGISVGGPPPSASSAGTPAGTGSYLLVTAPGWTVAGAYGADVGETGPEANVTYTDGTSTLTLSVQSVAGHGDLLADRLAAAVSSTTMTIGDAQATVIDRSDGRFAALWVSGDRSMELDGGPFPDAAAFVAVARTLSTVDERTWVAAGAPGTVPPAKRRAAVDALLTGVPLPDGLDVAALSDAEAVMDEEGLATWVYRGVACGWIGQWVAARDSGDTAAIDEAVAAMGTATQWPGLAGLPTGEDIVLLAGGMATGGVVDQSDRGHTDTDVAESYGSSLGCDGNPLLPTSD